MQLCHCQLQGSIAAVLPKAVLPKADVLLTPTGLQAQQQMQQRQRSCHTRTTSSSGSACSPCSSACTRYGLAVATGHANCQICQKIIGVSANDRVCNQFESNWMSAGISGEQGCEEGAQPVTVSTFCNYCAEKGGCSMTGCRLLEDSRVAAHHGLQEV